MIGRLEGIFSVLGHPKRIIIDARTTFTSRELKQYFENEGIQLFTAAIGMPKGNGQVERMNKIILEALATSGASTNKNNWDVKVIQIQPGINSTKHHMTNYSPTELLSGFQLKTDGDIYTIGVSFFRPGRHIILSP